MKKTLYLTFICCLNYAVNAQCLSGAYTIGGPTPNYITLASAITALTTNGVCGPVVFNIEPGTYTEQISIGNITGTSGVNNITFQSALLDSSSVFLEYASSNFSTNNYVVQLSGAKHVAFKHITVRRTGSLYYRQLVELKSAACNNMFQNIHFSATNTLNNETLMYSGNTIDSSNTVENCIFHYGGTAINFIGSSMTQEKNNRFINNQFIGQGTYGIYLEYQKSLVITDNTFIGDSLSTNHVACAAYSLGDTCQVIRNRVVSGYTGFVLSGAICTSWQKRLRIINNMIACQKGIGVYSSNYVQVEHNSVYGNFVSNGNTGGGLQEVTNNIFYSPALSAISLSNFSGTCNYNCLYSNNTVFGNYNNNPVTGGITNWRTISGKDANSVNAIPPFVSTQDLHIQYDNQLKETGIFGSSSLPTDFDNDLWKFTNPDIGADSFAVATLDAGGFYIDTTQFGTCPGSLPVNVKIKNYGATPLLSATLNWSINSLMQTPVSFSGNVSSGQVSSIIFLGNFTFPKDIVNTIKVWTSSPNGSSDNGILNDTLTYIYRFKNMTGVYTVGGTAPDYSDLLTAVTDLNARGICGPVTFNLRNGVYTTQNIFATPAGTSPVNTILIQSESGDSSAVILNCQLQITGNYTTIQKITLNVPTGTTSGSGIFLQGSYNGVKNCVINGVQNNGYTACVGVFGAVNEILNNRMNYSRTGVSLNNSQGLLTIKNNTLDSQSEYGLNLQFSTNSNIIAESNILTNQCMAMNISAVLGLISKNTISLRNNSVNAFGMYLSSLDSIVVEGNRITTAYDLIWGMMLDQAVNWQGTFNVFNNMISVEGAGSTFSAPTGIQTNALYSQIHHNSVCMSSAAGTETVSIAARIQTVNADIHNNLFINRNKGKAMKMNALLSGSNHNVLYTTGTTLIEASGSPYADLTAVNGFGYEMNSIIHNPNFISNSDLHITSDNAIAGTGIVISFVANDIDGDNRSATAPDRGADEFSFTTSNFEAAIFPETVVYPNPADEYLNISLPFGSPGEMSLQVFNANGQCLFKKTTTVNSSEIQSTFPGNLAEGIYFLKITFNDQVFNNKLLIHR